MVDNYTREALAIVVDSGIRGEHVVEAVEAVAAWRGAPRLIRVDNGPEFVSKVLDRWAYERRVTLDFSRPGEPTDNAFVESFNGRLQDECLDTHWFLSRSTVNLPENSHHRWASFPVQGHLVGRPARATRAVSLGTGGIGCCGRSDIGGFRAENPI